MISSLWSKCARVQSPHCRTQVKQIPLHLVLGQNEIQQAPTMHSPVDAGVLHHLSLSLGSIKFTLSLVFRILLFYSQTCTQAARRTNQLCLPAANCKRELCLCVNSRSQMRDSSPFAGVVTACSLCACRAVPTSQMPSCTPWDRTVLDSGKLMNIFSHNVSVKWLHGQKQCLYSAFRILEVARCSQLTDVGFTTLARVSVSFTFWDKNPSRNWHLDCPE